MKSGYLCGTAFAAMASCALLSASPVFAQDQAAPESADEGGIEEIIVSAEAR
jgi:hypothetical protein